MLRTSHNIRDEGDPSVIRHLRAGKRVNVHFIKTSWRRLSWVSVDLFLQRQSDLEQWQPDLNSPLKPFDIMQPFLGGNSRWRQIGIEREL